MESLDKNTEIFNAISVIVVSPEFNEDSQTFVENNYGIFDEEDENKHEYKQVYEDYVAIMDRVISARLKNENGFSESEIAAFLTSFEQNKDAYTATNADTVDTLYSFIDFMHFKKSMIDFKKGSKENSQAINEAGFTNKSENDKIRDAAGGSNAEAAIASYNDIMNEQFEGKGSAWNVKLNQTKPKNGILSMKISQRKHESLKNDLLRIDATFDDVDQEDFILSFMNPPPEQQKMIQEMVVLSEEGPYCKIMYWKMKIPMMSSRDNTMKITVTDHEGGRFVVAETVDHPDKPVQPGVVRMFIHTRGYVRPSKTIEGALDYTELSVFNMGGYMPARLLNMVIASETQKEFAVLV